MLAPLRSSLSGFLRRCSRRTSVKPSNIRCFTVFSDEDFHLKAIGFVQSPYDRKFGVPKQATIGHGEQPCQTGRIQLLPEFCEALDGLQGFDYVWVITHMHLNRGFKIKIKPMPVQDAKGKPPESVGLFSSRAPHRPNPLALSALRISNVNVDTGTIDVIGIDLLDGTPVLDIKPYVPAFDAFPDASAGWMDVVRGSKPEDIAHARTHGYQSISSGRGARSERARLRALRELGDDILRYNKMFRNRTGGDDDCGGTCDDQMTTNNACEIGAVTEGKPKPIVV